MFTSLDAAREAPQSRNRWPGTAAEADALPSHHRDRRKRGLVAVLRG